MLRYRSKVVAEQEDILDTNTGSSIDQHRQKAMSFLEDPSLLDDRLKDNLARILNGTLPNKLVWFMT